jgi:hypothetical protein
MRASRSKKKDLKQPIYDKPLIKVKLDNRTTITIRRMDIFKFWKEKYPDAKIIS